MDFMEKPIERNLILKVSKYGAEHSIFVYTDMKDALQLTSSDDEFLRKTCIKFNGEVTSGPNHLLVEVVVLHSNSFMSSSFRLLPTALYNYVDYMEIKEARRQAREAKFQSSLALMIAVGSLVIGSFIGLLGIIVQLVLTK